MDKEVNKKSKKIIIIYTLLIILVIVAVIFAIFSFIYTNSKSSIRQSDEIEVVPTLDDEIYSNSAWCGTFQLVWNDMQDKVVKKDIVFKPQIQFAENLNKQTFTENDISDDYYFKTYGLKTLDLKESIESGVKEKFNKESSIINNIDWSDAPQSDDGYENSIDKEYIFYTMLHKKFTYYFAFDELENDSFRGSKEKYNDVKYFGIGDSNFKALSSQVEVLYYNSKNDLAVQISTKEGDNIILAKGNNGNNFSGIFENIKNKSENYSGEKELAYVDTLKIPNINIDVEKNYDELCKNSAGTFEDYAGNTCSINQAIQTIELSLDKEGGEITSEASIWFDTSGASESTPKERNFDFNSTFNLFLVEEGKDKPYLALNVDDITLFQ